MLQPLLYIKVSTRNGHVWSQLKAATLCVKIPAVLWECLYKTKASRSEKKMVGPVSHIREKPKSSEFSFVQIETTFPSQGSTNLSMTPCLQLLEALEKQGVQAGRASQEITPVNRSSFFPRLSDLPDWGDKHQKYLLLNQQRRQWDYYHCSELETWNVTSVFMEVSEKEENLSHVGKKASHGRRLRHGIFHVNKNETPN